jgi:hypothetical protein
MPRHFYTVNKTVERIRRFGSRRVAPKKNVHNICILVERDTVKTPRNNTLLLFFECHNFLVVIIFIFTTCYTSQVYLLYNGIERNVCVQLFECNHRHLLTSFKCYISLILFSVKYNKSRKYYTFSVPLHYTCVLYRNVSGVLAQCPEGI